MAKFDNGVSFYTTGIAPIEIHFPENDIKCQWCPFCRAESDVGRFWCRLVSRMVYEPKALGLPDFCPIESFLTDDDKTEKSE